MRPPYSLVVRNPMFKGMLKISTEVYGMELTFEVLNV